MRRCVRILIIVMFGKISMFVIRMIERGSCWLFGRMLSRKISVVIVIIGWNRVRMLFILL